MNDYAYKTTAHRHSLKGETDDITGLKKVDQNHATGHAQGEKRRAILHRSARPV